MKKISIACGLCVTLTLSASPTQAQNAQETLHEIEHFFAGAQVLSGPTLVECTLSEGEKSRCFSITVKPDPTTYTPGPWCPGNVVDGTDSGGIWFDDDEVEQVDGAFVAELSTFYSDPAWQLYNPETGDIRFTDTKEACAAAARPDVDAAYQNYCVQCLPEYISEGATQTYVIPLEPVPATRIGMTNFVGSGLAANGVKLDGPAPVEDILSAYTLAPFDDCGGHVNLHAGYHYHAVTDCLVSSKTDVGHGPQIGIAMDGYRIYSQQDSDTAQALDQCNGHVTEPLDYHYHAGAEGSNAILGCLVAQKYS